MAEALKGLLVLGSVGFLFSLVLAFLGEKLKVREDPLVVKILELLPGVNCGACGLSGCRAFAEEIVKQRNSLLCRPAGEETNKRIAGLLDLSAKVISAQKAVVRCGAEKKDKKYSSIYRGPSICSFAHILGAGLDCKYGCLGFGDCIDVCPVKAISIKNDKVHVDIKKCVGCGKCLEVCPRNIFELVPFKKEVDVYSVSCNNKEKAVYTRKVCARGCTACGLCLKVEDSPFYLKNNLSHIDYSKLKNRESLNKAKDKCPTHCIDKVVVYLRDEINV